MLEVSNLDVRYDVDGDTVQAVDNLSFEIKDGENIGILGESGCGKSTLAKAILGNLPENGFVDRGEIIFKGTDLTNLTKNQRRKYKWDEISMIPQSAMNALDPVYTVREQIDETFQAHRRGIEKAKSHETINELFDLVGLDPDRADDYPHQFSGGMRQRAMIAMSLALNPSLIIADEPTTALDVIMQDQILKKINELQDVIESSLLLITHDVSVVAETCDYVLIMYAGEIVDQGPVSEIYSKPYHPYTLGLKHAFPNIREFDQDLISLSGHPPDLRDPPEGCRFANRCPIASTQCFEEEPPVEQINDVRPKCHHTNEIDEELRPSANSQKTWRETMTREEYS